MTELDSLLVDELRGEFRRTRPPLKAITNPYRAGIFRLTATYQTGYRILWYREGSPLLPSFYARNILFELLEELPL